MKTIDNFIHDLKFQDGIWMASKFDKVSCPDNGNDSCYKIEDQSFWFKIRNNIIYEVIRNYSMKGPIFDVGGGNGFVSSYLNKLGFETVLVEPGINGCINGKERGLQNVVNSNFDIVHFYPGSIPNIGIFDVLEHIENQHQFLRILNTNMVPGGRLSITVPSLNMLWSEEDKQAGHYRRYCIQGLSKLIDDNGFDVLYASYFFSFLVLPIILFRTIPSKIGIYRISSKNSQKQHLLKSNRRNILEFLLKFEIKKIKKGSSILFGSSILIVARKR